MSPPFSVTRSLRSGRKAMPQGLVSPAFNVTSTGGDRWTWLSSSRMRVIIGTMSDADTMLLYLDANAQLPHDVAVFSRDGCTFCVRAKGMLRDAGIEFEELVLNRDYTDRTLRAVSTNTTYPQVFVNGKLIGGSDDLAEWLAERAQARAA